jgi:hypothetical protein
MTNPSTLHIIILVFSLMEVFMYPYTHPGYEMASFPMCYYCNMNRTCMIYQSMLSSQINIDSNQTRYSNNYYTNYYSEDNFIDDSEFDSLYRNNIERKKSFSTEEAMEIAKQLEVEFTEFDVEQFRTGLDVELEHGLRDPRTNVTGDDPLLTGKIALAHLYEFPDYYTRLTRMENEAKAYWGITEV